MRVRKMGQSLEEKCHDRQCKVQTLRLQPTAPSTDTLDQYFASKRRPEQVSMMSAFATEHWYPVPANVQCQLGEGHDCNRSRPGVQAGAAFQCVRW